MSRDAAGGDQPVGIMPAAGWARRSPAMPCSKEVFPLGVVPDDRHPSGARARLACDDLLRGFRRAGASRAVVVLRPGKWDIPGFLESGVAYELTLAYMTIADSPGVPWTVRAALPFVEGARVVFGFPDMAIKPVDALATVAERQQRTGADVVLGLFPAHRPELVDMVDTSPDGRVRDIVIKPTATDLHYTWLLACWSPTFSEFLARFVGQLDVGARPTTADEEIHFGDAVRAAVEEGYHVDGVAFGEGSYTDMGTPEQLVAAMRLVD